MSIVLADPVKYDKKLIIKAWHAQERILFKKLSSKILREVKKILCNLQRPCDEFWQEQIRICSWIFCCSIGFYPTIKIHCFKSIHKNDLTLQIRFIF